MGIQRWRREGYTEKLRFKGPMRSVLRSRIRNAKPSPYQAKLDHLSIEGRAFVARHGGWPRPGTRRSVETVPHWSVLAMLALIALLVRALFG